MKKYFLMLLTSIISSTHMFGAQQQTAHKQAPLEILVALSSSNNKPAPCDIENNRGHLQRLNIEIKDDRYCFVQSVKYQENGSVWYWQMPDMHCQQNTKTPAIILSRDQEDNENQAQPFPFILPYDLVEKSIITNSPLMRRYKDSIPVVMRFEDPEDALGIRKTQKIRCLMAGGGILLLVALLAYLCNRK